MSLNIMFVLMFRYSFVKKMFYVCFRSEIKSRNILIYLYILF